MKTPFSYSSSFILDKSHFNECFEQSVSQPPFTKLYAKALFLTLFGAILVLFVDVNPYAAWFVFSLGILEAVSSYYRKPWWVMRQMLSKAAKSEVQLTLDEQGIHSQSFYHNISMKFNDINGIKATTSGWLISHSSGRHYISNRCLSSEAQQFLQNKISIIGEAKTV